MDEIRKEEAWLVMEAGDGSAYVLVNTGDVDESQIVARCKTEKLAQFICDAWDYYSRHLEYLKNLAI